VAASGCGSVETETVTVVRTETVTRTETEAEPALPVVLPPPVEEKRAAILSAAESGDYEALRPLLANNFSYTFGGAVEGGPIAYWQDVERESGESPIAILVDLLKLPPTLHGGVYTWPFAFDKQPEELTEYERGLLRSVGGQDLSDDFGEGSGYLGWRAGIEPDGDWIFFIAGD
jgi:hypothetical protein